MTGRVFGRDVIYQLRPENTSISMKAVFDNAFIEINGVTTTAPILTVDLSLIPRYPSVKDIVTIESVNYRVIEVRQDSFGGAILILQR